jgi:hypothetical protein
VSRVRLNGAGIAAGAPLLLATLGLLGGLVTNLARGEQKQRGNLIMTLDGGLSPLTLPRDRPAPISIRLEGGLRTADGSTLPRVTKIELGLPGQGVLSTRGLPVCSRHRIRHATSAKALAYCGPALIGHGRLLAQVVLPHQAPFKIEARLLAFNGRMGNRRAVILHAVSADPPSSVVLPFLIRRRSGRLGTSLVANLPSALGPWPRFAHFEMELSRHYRYAGRSRSYLSASCPIPKRFSAGFFSFARASFTLADGRRLGTGIPRTCRAR